LQKNAGKTMYVYSNNVASEIPSCLIFVISEADKIIGDFSGAWESIKNIPSFETFFEPKPTTAYGKLVMKSGSYQNLENAVEGRIDISFSNGRIKRVENKGGKDLKILEYLQRDLQDLANSHFAEMGIGTFTGSSDIPWEEAVYNRIILEKKKGFHIAYGDSKVFGGIHEAPVHVDNLFTYGNVYVGNDALIRNGKLREKVLTFN